MGHLSKFTNIMATPMNEGQNSITSFSDKRYSKSKSRENVPVYYNLK